MISRASAGLVSAVVGAILLSGCGDASKLEGRWSCDLPMDIVESGMPAGVNVSKADLDVSFLSNKQVDLDFYMVMSDSNMKLEMEMVLMGDWSLSGKKLNIEFNDAELTHVSMNGEAMPRNLIRQMESEMVGELDTIIGDEEGPVLIKTLTDSRLVWQQKDGTVSCRR